MSKVVLITGASSGLGLTMAKHLTRKGYEVYGTSRQLRPQAMGFNLLQADVTDGPSVQRAVDEILLKQGRIDVVINNAGLGIASPVEAAPIDDVQRVLDTNITGIIRVVQAVLPSMRERRAGLIVNISSIGAEMGLPYRGVYSATKAAVERITEALRTELAAFGVQACSIQPGGVRTNINQNRLTAPLPEGNVYRDSFEAAYKIINASVAEGMEADLFARLVEDIINQPRVKARYRLGKPKEQLSVWLKKLLPTSVFERMIRKHYGLK